eukprot:1146929-Pelagomonas_calceolata.AAC.3
MFPLHLQPCCCHSLVDIDHIATPATITWSHGLQEAGGKTEHPLIHSGFPSSQMNLLSRLSRKSRTAAWYVALDVMMEAILKCARLAYKLYEPHSRTPWRKLVPHHLDV